MYRKFIENPFNIITNSKQEKSKSVKQFEYLLNKMKEMMYEKFIISGEDHKLNHDRILSINSKTEKVSRI